MTKKDGEQGNLARLTYQLDGRRGDDKPLAEINIVQRFDGAWEVDYIGVAERRKGIASRLYDAVEEDLGIRMSPSGMLSDAGLAFWQNRSPASVQWHVPTPTWAGFNFSPAKIEKEMVRVKDRMRELAAKGEQKDAKAESDRQDNLKGLRSEFNHLKVLWSELPEEARARKVLDSMFALRGFYSPAIRAAEGINQQKGTGEQFWKQITKVPGVRKDELEWMGLEEFLADKKSITKAEVLDFMRAHQVELDEKVLSGTTEATGDLVLLDSSEAELKRRLHLADDELPDGTNVNVWKYAGGGDVFYIAEGADGAFHIYGDEDYITSATSLSQAQHIAAGHRNRTVGEARFEGYKVPGGTNYRELLIRLPELGEIKFTAADQKRLEAVQAEVDRLRKEGLSSFDPRMSRAMDEVERLLTKQTQPLYESQHFHDQEIVHLRVDDRVGPNGEKILFVNEVQSDLHQKGRKQGYGKPRLTQKQLQLRLEMAEISKAMRENPAGSPEWTRAIEREQELRKDPEFSTATQKLEGTRMPDAPFKGDLWLELALKRALLYAAENGYDAVSWARSDQIAKAVGADQADLALQYDQKIGKFLDKYTRKWGGKVDPEGQISDLTHTAMLESGLADEGWKGGRNPLLRITPEMRASVLEGQPLAVRRQSPQAQQPEALGRTDPYNFIISLAMKAIEVEAASKGKKTEQEAIRVLRHEAVEFFKATGFFDPKEWQLLERTAKQKGWIETTGVRAAYEDLYAKGMSEADLNKILIKEAIAEQYSEFHLGKKQFTPAITKIFERIRTYLRRIANWMKGQGFQTWEDVFTKIDEGEFKRRFDEAFGSPQTVAQGGVAPMQATAGKLGDSPARQASAGTDQPSMSLADIISRFNAALGLTVRQGRIDPGLKRAAAQMGAEVRGQASRETGVIRLQVPNEIDTLAHEGGHALENRFKGDLEAIKQQFAGELTPLASPGPDSLSEGFAEWFRRYVTNPAASVRTAPGFEAAFEEFLDAQDPEMLASLQEIRQGYQEWISAPSGGAVASSIATTVPPGSTKEFVREFKEEGLRKTFHNWIDRIYTAVFDDLHPIRQTVDALMEIASSNLNLRKGQTLGLKTVNNPYRLLRLARDGYAAGHMDLLHGVHGYKSTTPQGPSFRDALGTAFSGFDKSQWNEAISKDFGAYLTSRRMVQEWARFQAGELSAPPDKFSLADHQQSIRDFEAKYPGFQKGAQQLYRFQNNMLQKKLAAGLITQELFDTLVARQDYVPVMRDMSDRGGVEGRQSSRKDKFSIIRRFRGSQRDVINPLESIAKDAYETAMIIARNDAVKALDALARAAGPDGGKFAERIPAKQWKATQVNIPEAIKAAAKDAGIDPADMQIMLQAVDDQLGDNAIAQIWRAGDITEKGEAIIYLWDKGERIPIRLADGQFGHDMLHSFAGLNREAADWWINILSLPSTILRTGVTAAPDFIGANFVRDQLSAWVLTRDFVPFYDGARGIYNDLTMKDVSRIYARAGGIMGGSNVAALHESRVKREVLELRRKGIRFTLNPFTRDFWRMTEFSETGTRLAVFQRAFDRAKKDGLQDWEATVEAAYTARDYIDFGRRGSRMLAARRLIPFFNAALQGLDREVRGLRGKISEDRILQEAISPYIKSRTGQPLSLVERKNKGRAVRVFAYMVALGMLGLAQSLIYRDDEEYEEISDYIKSTHWLFRFNGEWVRIPKPFTLGTFSNFFERTFDYVYRNDKTAPERFASGLLEMTVPPHSIPGLAVTTELLTDYNFFTGRPIVGSHLKSLPPELQFNAYASEFGKWFGKQVGVSPAYVDHFITGFGASYGREFVNASDRFMPALGRATDGLFGLPKGPVADPAVQDYFFVRRFTTDPARGSNSVRQFWDLMSFENGQFIRAANGYKHLVDKVRDALGAQEFLDGLNDEEKAYALLQMGNKDGRSKLRNLHPLNRAEEIVSITNGIKKEINLNRLYKDAGKKRDGEQIVLSPSEMRTASDLLTDIQMREARNALIALKVRGWEQRKPIETESVYAELEAAAPEVHAEMTRRLTTKKLPSYETVVKGWPIARDRILEDGQKAIISDLYSRDVDVGSGEGVTLQ